MIFDVPKTNRSRLLPQLTLMFTFKLPATLRISCSSSALPQLPLYAVTAVRHKGAVKITCRSHFAAEFSIWTREAGAGGLSIAVEGPSKAEITFEDRKDGSCGVAYVVQEPGERKAL